MTNFAPAISKSELWLAVELLSFLHSKPAPVAKLVDAHALGVCPVRGAGSIPRGVKLAATLGMEDGGGIYVNSLRLEER